MPEGAESESTYGSQTSQNGPLPLGGLIDPPQWMGVGRSLGGIFYSHGSRYIPCLLGFLGIGPTVTPIHFSASYSHSAYGSVLNSGHHVLTPKRAHPASVTWY